MEYGNAFGISLLDTLIKPQFSWEFAGELTLLTLNTAAVPAKSARTVSRQFWFWLVLNLNSWFKRVGC